MQMKKLNKNKSDLLSRFKQMIKIMKEFSPQSIICFVHFDNQLVFADCLGF
jgi:hypothetical protein